MSPERLEGSVLFVYTEGTAAFFSSVMLCMSAEGTVDLRVRMGSRGPARSVDVLAVSFLIAPPG